MAEAQRQTPLPPNVTTAERGGGVLMVVMVVMVAEMTPGALPVVVAAF